MRWNIWVSYLGYSRVNRKTILTGKAYKFHSLMTQEVISLSLIKSFSRSVKSEKCRRRWEMWNLRGIKWLWDYSKNEFFIKAVLSLSGCHVRWQGSRLEAREQTLSSRCKTYFEVYLKLMEIFSAWVWKSQINWMSFQALKSFWAYSDFFQNELEWTRIA